jgi:hypothetical protein
MCVYRHFVALRKRATLSLKFSRSGLNWVIGGLYTPRDENATPGIDRQRGNLYDNDYHSIWI